RLRWAGLRDQPGIGLDPHRWAPWPEPRAGARHESEGPARRARRADRPGAAEVRAPLVQGAAGRGARRRGCLARRSGGGRLTLRPATQFREVSAAEALELAASGWRILDVREQGEWNEGHIPTATLLPLADLPSRIAEVAPDRDAPLLVHCAVGARSLRASAWLVQNGYTSVVSMRASLLDWRRLGGAWVAPEQLLTP